MSYKYVRTSQSKLSLSTAAGRMASWVNTVKWVAYVGSVAGRSRLLSHLVTEVDVSLLKKPCVSLQFCPIIIRSLVQIVSMDDRT